MHLPSSSSSSLFPTAADSSSLRRRVLDESCKPSAGSPAKANMYEATPETIERIMEACGSPAGISASRKEMVDNALTEVRELCRRCVLDSGAVDEIVDLGEVRVIGAHKLNVALPADDADIVFLAPWAASSRNLSNLVAERTTPSFRRIGYGSFFEQLEILVRCALERHPHVENVAVIGPDGEFCAPGLGFCYAGVAVKLYLSYNLSMFAEEQLVQVCPRERSGFEAHRIAELLLTNLPDVENFKFLLRCVRFWTMRRGIYGREYGYFGGLAWAICCASICERCPDSNGTELLRRFFCILDQRDWQYPIILDRAARSSASTRSEGPLEVVDVWNLVRSPVGECVSVQPHMNQTTMQITLSEINRAHQIITSENPDFVDVCQVSQFFLDYTHYIQISFVAVLPDILNGFHSWCLARLHMLVPQFEAKFGNTVELKPWPETMESRHTRWPNCRTWLLAIRVMAKPEVTTDSQKASDDGQTRSATEDGPASSRHENDCVAEVPSLDCRGIFSEFVQVMMEWPYARKYVNQFDLVIRYVNQNVLQHWLQNWYDGVPADLAYAAEEDVSVGGISF